MPWLLLLMGKCSPGVKGMTENWDITVACKYVFYFVR